MSHSGDQGLDDVMLYELCPYLSSVFEAKMLCKLDNPFHRSELILKVSKHKNSLKKSGKMRVLDKCVK